MVKVTIIKDGPALVIPQEESWVDVEGEGFIHVAAVGKPVAICRCGKSKNGVTCDGSHKIKKEE